MKNEETPEVTTGRRGFLKAAAAGLAAATLPNFASADEQDDKNAEALLVKLVDMKKVNQEQALTWEVAQENYIKAQLELDELELDENADPAEITKLTVEVARLRLLETQKREIMEKTSNEIAQKELLLSVNKRLNTKADKTEVDAKIASTRQYAEGLVADEAEARKAGDDELRQQMISNHMKTLELERRLSISERTHFGPSQVIVEKCCNEPGVWEQHCVTLPCGLKRLRMVRVQSK